MHSSHSRARRRQDSRSPVRDRDRSPVLLPRGHTHDADQGSRSSYSHAHSRSQPQPTSSRTSQSRRKTHQHDLPPPPYPASSAGLRDDRRDDHYGAAPVNVYSSHRHEDYYDRPEDSWPRSSHYQTEWNGRTEDYGYQESGWLPPQYVNGPHDHWVPSDARRDHRYEPREQPYAREERRQSWPVEESWPPPRGRDPINNWQPPSQSSWSPRKEPVDRGMRHDERVWQPAPNWQERRQSTRQENEQLPRSRYDGDDRRAHSYRADEKADTEARTPKNRAQKTHNGKTTKRQRSPSLTRSRSVSRSPRSRPTSPFHSRSPKRRRHEAEDIRDKSHRERPRKRSTSRESRTSVKADTRDRGRKRQRSLSPSSSRSRSPVAAPRALHRLPGPQPLRKLPPPTEPLSVKPTNNIADKAPTNGQANGTRRNKQRNNDQELRSGSNSIQPRPQTRRNPEDMDQDPPRDQAVHKDNGKARTGGKQSNNDKPQTPLVKKFFPGDEEESTPHRAGLGRQSLPARPDLPSRPQALQSPAGRELPRQVAGPSKEPARVAPSPLHALDRGLNDSARSSPRIPPPLYAPSPSLPPRPLGPSQNPTPTSRPTPTPRRTEEAHATTDSRSDELATLQTTADLFKVVAKVGEGTFGQVYKAGNGAGGFVALKRIRMESEREGFPVTAMREIKLLQSLSHVNIVKLHEMMISKGAVYMVCEYMNHDLTGVLCQKQFIFSPAHIKALCRQMFAGLAYLHHKGVIHRDLKGSNILLNNRGELKLADFGLARFYHKRRQADYTNRVITQWYRPPELLLGATVYGPEVDMWSAGCIMLELFTRRPIFQGDDEIHQLQVIYRVMGTPNTVEWPELVEQPWYELVKPKEVVPSQFRESFSRWLSPAALDVAQALLAYNPKRRMSAAQALAAPYFLSEDPRPEMPTGLSTLIGEWHELDSKKERAERAKQKRRVDEENVGDATGTRE